MKFLLLFLSLTAHAYAPNNVHIIPASGNIATWGQVDLSSSGAVKNSCGIVNGGTGAATQQAAINALTGTQSSGEYLRSDGTNATLSTINPSDIATFTSIAKGVVPASGGGTTNFLRADGTFSAPPGGTGSVTSVGLTVPAAFSVSGSPVTSSGTLAVSYSGTAIPIANGGTSATSKSAAFDALSPMNAGGQIIYGGASGTGTALANGSAGQFLQSQGGTSAPIWSNPSIALYTPNTQSLTSGTSATYGVSYWFTVSSASATAGAVYTNNSNSFTVARTISSSTLLLMTNTTGAPLTSGTLTKSSGTGDATITFSASRAPIYLRVKAFGGGGGGGGGGTGATTSGGAGGTTTFGTSLLSATGGGGGGINGYGAVGGTGSISSPAIGFPLTGGFGGAYQATSTTSYASGGQGGGTILCPNGGSGPPGGFGTAQSGPTNTGAGGGGGGAGGAALAPAAAGGGGGGGVDAIIYNPSATYTYTIGAGGTHGASGANGFDGGIGGSGVINVEEFFQ